MQKLGEHIKINQSLHLYEVKGNNSLAFIFFYYYQHIAYLSVVCFLSHNKNFNFIQTRI